MTLALGAAHLTGRLHWAVLNTAVVKARRIRERATIHHG
jgi:hypothetical protein